MKKISLFLAAAIALSSMTMFTGCGSSTDAGSYNLYSILLDDGEMYTKEEYEEIYEAEEGEIPEQHLQLNDDGTGEFIYYGDLYDIKWKNGKLTMYDDDGEQIDDPLDYTIKDGKLTLKEDNGDLEIVYERN